MTDMKVFTAADVPRECDMPVFRGHREFLAEHFNRLLTERGVRVYGYSFGWSTSICDDESPTHQAWLVNSQPIVKESAEDVLRDMITRSMSETVFKSERDWFERIRKVLGAE